jgi:hypothetical protein
MIIDDKKEYLLQATIIEARHLKGKDSSGMSNPFVKLVCGDLPAQATEVVYESLTPTWNQTFTFQGMMMNNTDLQTSELTFEVHSRNNFFSNDLIGSFSVNLSTLYKNANHEYFNVWLVLSNPNEDPDESQGYLLVSCFIIGPGDRPPVHDANEKVNQDTADDDEDVDIDQMTFEQLRAYQEKKQGIVVLGKPMVARKSFQLSVYVFKAEHLVNFGSVLGPRKPTAFISARAVGLVQKTRKVKDNSSPTYNQKMLFPCYFPFLNDKILMRIWNENQGAADEFISNIPEFPLTNDFFNISKLIAIGGRMPAKWINLYGIPPNERNTGMNLGGKRKHPREGTYFMGRVLISFSLLANEKPGCATVPCNPFYEPDTQPYRLFCDIYEVKYLKESQFDITVWCDCRIGPFTTGDNKHKKPKKDRVVWELKEKVNEITLPQIDLGNLPKDLAQVPDIFINLYTGGDAKTGERIGYIRLDPEEVIKWEPIPRWLHFKPLDMNLDSPGSVLCNLQFLIETENTRRVFKQKGILKKFLLHYYIVQGFELDPKSSDENVVTFAEVTLDTKTRSTKIKKGRFPFYNDYDRITDVELDFKLDFAPDVVVICYKQVKSGLFSDKWENQEIGRFTVPIRSITKDGKKYPHYFNLIKNNEVTGRIMAMFYIEPQLQNMNEIKFKDIFAIRHDLKEEKKLKADVKIFVLGMRNMEFEPDIKKVEFDVVLCMNNEQMKSTKNALELERVNNDNDKEKQNILNVIEMFEFKDVEIYGRDEFQVFPFAKIMFRQKRLFYDDERFYLFNLSEYCEFISDHTKKLYRLLFQQNLGVTRLDQDQVFIEEFEKVKVKNLEDEEEELANQQKEEKEKKEKELLAKEKPQTIKEEVFDEDADRKMVKQLTKYKNMVISDEIALLCMHRHKEREKQIKKNLRKKLVYEFKEIQKRDLNGPEEILRLLDLQEEVRRLKKPQMSEAMFYGFDDIGDEFDYGRDVWKEDIYEAHTDLEIPYSRKFLFYIPKSLFTDKYQTMGGYLRLGKESPCFIKFSVDIKIKDTDPGNSLTKKNTNTRAANYLIKSEEENDDELEEEIKKELINYNIFNEIFLRKLRNLYLNKTERKKLSNQKKEIVVPLTGVKVRVYVYRCLNLTAQDNNATVIDRLAGYAAFCKADAFLEIKVGNNDSSMDSSKGVKKIVDRSAYVPDSLSPEFFKYFELEADLPEDWKLTINVMSRIEGALTDTLIGSTEIDLEDRYLGEIRTRNLLKYKSLEAFYEDWLRQLEKKESEDNSELINKINKKILFLNQKADDLKPCKIPVEYRPLTKPGTKTAQGIIEMFVEVFPPSIAKIIKPSKIEPPPPQEYELRLIIWETRNIPLGRKKALDVMIKVMYDPEGWLSKEIKKETDVHLGCDDGHAIFNWRMKFPIKIPCTFPRLYFSVFNFSAFSSDEAIGTCYISLKRIFKRLLQEGKLVIDKKWIPLSSLEDPGETKGEICYSAYLLQKYEADQAPVGEAQDEPNRDPKLERPTVGRGIGDFFKSLDFNLDFNFSLFGFFKKFIIMGLLVLVFVVLFVAPGILTK